MGELSELGTARSGAKRGAERKLPLVTISISAKRKEKVAKRKEKVPNENKKLPKEKIRGERSGLKRKKRGDGNDMICVTFI